MENPVEPRHAYILVVVDALSQRQGNILYRPLVPMTFSETKRQSEVWSSCGFYKVFDNPHQCWRCFFPSFSYLAYCHCASPCPGIDVVLWSVGTRLALK